MTVISTPLKPYRFTGAGLGGRGWGDISFVRHLEFKGDRLQINVASEHMAVAMAHMAVCMAHIAEHMAVCILWLLKILERRRLEFLISALSLKL